MSGQIQLQLGSYIHIQMKHPPAHLQDLIPTLAGIYNYIHSIHTSQKGIKSGRYAGGCVSFVH